MIFALIATSGLMLLMFVLLWIEHDFDYAWAVFDRFVEDMLK